MEEADMGTDISLFLERNHGDHWATPGDLIEKFGEMVGGALKITWWPLRWGVTDLFFGERPVFPFRKGLPEDLSPEVQRVVAANFEKDQTYAGWAPVDELLPNCWENETIQLELWVMAKHATLFRDGRRPCPTGDLEALGLDYILDKIRYEYSRGPSHSPPQDRQYSGVNELSHLSGEHFVPVTYTETLAEFAGVIWTEGISNLAGLNPQENYRVVTGIG
jgi:hypothetical protein